MSAIIFLDTETLGLGLDDPIWEVAAIRRELDGTERRYHWLMCGPDDEPLLTPPGFPEPFRGDFLARYRGGAAATRRSVAAQLRVLFQGRPHIVGAVPNFDTERLAHQFGVSGWHHHLIDVEALAVGWLAGRGEELPGLPWDSDDLSRLVEVDPDDYDRHTAMGDVRWARAIYDRTTGREQ